jgi:hypothetical protein
VETRRGPLDLRRAPPACVARHPPPPRPLQAYQPFFTKLAAVYDVMLYGRTVQIEMEEIFAPKQTKYESKLVQMAYEADRVQESPDRSLYF